MSRNQTTGQIRPASPNWAGQAFDGEFLMGIKLDSNSFTSYSSDVVITTTAAAAVGATSLTVSALSAAVPAGVSLNYGVPGIYAVTNGVAAAGATSLPVVALVNAIASGASATFKGWRGREVAAGTFVSRTIAQRNAGTGWHPAILTNNPEAEFGLLAFDVTDVTSIDDAVLLQPFTGFTVKENFLPTASANTVSGTDSTFMAAMRLRGAYNFVVGQE